MKEKTSFSACMCGKKIIWPHVFHIDCFLFSLTNCIKEEMRLHSVRVENKGNKGFKIRRRGDALLNSTPLFPPELKRHDVNDRAEVSGCRPATEQDSSWCPVAPTLTPAERVTKGRHRGRGQWGRVKHSQGLSLIKKQEVGGGGGKQEGVICFQEQLQLRVSLYYSFTYFFCILLAFAFLFPWFLCCFTFFFFTYISVFSFNN